MGTRIGIARNPTPRSQTKRSLRKFDARPTYILSWALQSTWMRWGDHGDDDQRVWLRMHHLIHVLQRGRVICASHIAVFETIVKNLLRQRNLPKTTSTLKQAAPGMQPQISHCRRNPKHITSMVTNASFHSCINVRVYKGRLPQATTLRYLKPLSRICRQGLPPARRNPSSTTQNQGNLRSVTVAAIQSTSTSIVTNASFHSCISYGNIKSDTSGPKD